MKSPKTIKSYNIFPKKNRIHRFRPLILGIGSLSIFILTSFGFCSLDSLNSGDKSQQTKFADDPQAPGLEDNDQQDPPVGTTDCSDSQIYSVLFLGNSYTGANNLAKIVAEIGCSDDILIDYSKNHPGGKSLSGHRYDSNSQDLINAKQWDAVILQDQSQTPSQQPATVLAVYVPPVQELVGLINANNSSTEIIFYETWGRRLGDSDNCDFYPLTCTFAGHTQALQEGYLQYRNNSSGTIAHVGTAWKQVVDNNDPVFAAAELWSADNSHPTFKGSYLAALVIYEKITKRSLTNLSYIGSLTSAEAEYLQQVAQDIADND